MSGEISCCGLGQIKPSDSAKKALVHGEFTLLSPSSYTFLHPGIGEWPTLPPASKPVYRILNTGKQFNRTV
jgi:hypothetical protein